MSSETPRWSVAIFAARETPEILTATIRAVIAACASQPATIDVLINGNQALATHVAELMPAIPPGGCMLRVWAIAAPDKAHTWNEYVHRIWDGVSTTFFVDGYVRVKPEALSAIDRRLKAMPESLIGTGVPTCGRSAKRMREEMLLKGGIHGNLYAVRSDGMRLLKDKGFRFPLGLYRSDPMLGSALACRLDPSDAHPGKGPVVVGDATWDVDGISELTYQNIVGYFKRKVRQAQGMLENRAVREHMAIKRLPPQLLPGTVQELVTHWLSAKPTEARRLFLTHPLCLYAARKLHTPRDWTKTHVAPSLLGIYCGNDHGRMGHDEALAYAQ